MKIHEYQSRKILTDAGIPVPPAEVVFTPDEAAIAFKKFGGQMCVVKAQVYAGGGGEAGFAQLAPTAPPAPPPGQKNLSPHPELRAVPAPSGRGAHLPEPGLPPPPPVRPRP